MKNIIKAVAVVAVAVAITSTVQAVPITGVIGFAGSAVLNNVSAPAATEVLSWGPNIIGLNTGTFASLDNAASVAFASPWFFNSSTLNGFWVVTDGANTFTFNLSGSSVTSTSATSITVALAGTVLSNIVGLDPTAFTGSLTVQNPSAQVGNGAYKFTESISFNSVPDGGTTALLLGSALSGLALLRRKLSA